MGVSRSTARCVTLSELVQCCRHNSSFIYWKLRILFAQDRSYSTFKYFCAMDLFANNEKNFLRQNNGLSRFSHVIYMFLNVVYLTIYLCLYWARVSVS